MDYEEFRAQYEKQHPASVPRLEHEQAEHPAWMVIVVGFMFAASAIFSGVHTVPTAYDAIESAKVAQWVMQVAGLSAFVFVELGILVAAYMLFRRFSLLFLLILLTAVSVAMIANLHSVSKALNAQDELTKAVAILLGIGAPLMAMLSGAVFVDLYRSYRNADIRAQRRLREAQVAWDASINREFSKHQRTEQTDISAARLSVQTDSRQTGYGYERNSSAVEVALQYLKDNPDKINKPLRELGEAAGVGKDSVAKARRILQNGHGEI